MPQKSIRFTLPATEHEQLVQLAQARHSTVSELVRQAVRVMYLQQSDTSTPHLSRLLANVEHKGMFAGLSEIMDHLEDWHDQWEADAETSSGDPAP
ncbi:MAG: hypothetical protein KKA73_30755 [Chloroflexi bacterium]|nr:hypothetical protein [Chloroflexota bacterium]MBU1752082.1 hypothetical protein [Chloroflexota bacterium]MBU1877636.1 hypothetical protein [Chloroflexota bacterium]